MFSGDAIFTFSFSGKINAEGEGRLVTGIRLGEVNGVMASTKVCELNVQIVQTIAIACSC